MTIVHASMRHDSFRGKQKPKIQSKILQVFSLMKFVCDCGHAPLNVDSVAPTVLFGKLSPQSQIHISLMKPCIFVQVELFSLSNDFSLVDPKNF